MGFFSRKPEGSNPTEDRIRKAAAALNAGDEGPADQLVEESGAYGKYTAMRIIGYCVMPPEDE